MESLNQEKVEEISEQIDHPQLSEMVEKAGNDYEQVRDSLLKMLSAIPNRTKEKKFKQKVENSEEPKELIQAILKYTGKEVEI